MKKQNARTLLLIASTLAYLLVGAAVFDALESTFEETERAALAAEERKLRTKYNFTDREFDAIRNNVIRSIPHKAGVQWKFDGALFFVTTVITTIGQNLFSTSAAMHLLPTSRVTNIQCCKIIEIERFQTDVVSR